jgi:multicomponent K+:H+ antiporter subunit A
VLLLLGLRWLPKRIEEANPLGAKTSVIRWYRVRDFAIAVTAGAGLAMLSYVTMTRPQPQTIAGFFVENAYIRGGGTNVVNVILVDFRAFDTFGEITVLGIVALTVYALLRRFRPAAESIPVPEQQRSQNLYDETQPNRRKGDTVRGAMAIPALMMTMLFPVVGATAAFLLLRGHDLPGGGFVAGVTMAVAFILQYMAHGTEWVEARLRVLPVRWMGIGLLLVVGVGCAAWLFDRPFLSSSFSYVQLPLLGEIPIASALLFDLGVFALVLGATILMLIAIAHQSVRSHRAPVERTVAPPPATKVQ